MAQQGKVLTTDVLIVGSGGAGVAAAIDAREAGASVIVIEQEATLGGAAAISGGGCFIVGSPLQKAQGFQDSCDMAFEDWVAWGAGMADEEWARFYIDQSCHSLYFWAERNGVRWVEVLPQEANRVPRWHLAQDGGSGLWSALYQSAVTKGAIQWLTSTPADQLIMEDGRVVGVRAQNTKTREKYQIRAKAMVMACGGFASNQDMIYDSCPQLREYRVLEGSAVGNKGAGHMMIQEIGGYLTHMDLLWLYAYGTPDYKDPSGKRGIVIRGIVDSIWVNAQGKRFHNEALFGGGTATPALMAQDPPYSWAIVDGTMIDGLDVADPYYRRGTEVIREKVQELIANSPYIKRAQTIQELAREMGVDGDAFVETMRRYNGFISDGRAEDPDLGKSLEGRKRLEIPPFYAIQFFLLARKNFGGVKTNLKCQVVDRHFRPIPGLYAAGELAGMAGGHINGLRGLEGTMLGPSLLSGRVAGAWAANEAGYGPGFVGVERED